MWADFALSIFEGGDLRRLVCVLASFFAGFEVFGGLFCGDLDLDIWWRREKRLDLDLW
jgi:hypothetical protein